MDTQPNSDRPVARRATSIDVQLRRRALIAVRPFNKQISYWQVTAARLISFGERGRTHGTFLPTHIVELEALEQAVTTQVRSFEEAVSQLPVEIRRHGRIADTRNALASLNAALNRARSLLSPGRRV
jgi:hypothetical protein